MGTTKVEIEIKFGYKYYFFIVLLTPFYDAHRGRILHAMAMMRRGVTQANARKSYSRVTPGSSTKTD